MGSLRRDIFVGGIDAYGKPRIYVLTDLERTKALLASMQPTSFFYALGIMRIPQKEGECSLE